MTEPTTQSPSAPAPSHPSRPASRSGLARRAGIIAIELAVLVGIWFVLKTWLQITFDLKLVAAIAVVIVLSGIVPERISQVASGIGMFALAALAYFYYGQLPLAAVLGIFGVFSLAAGLPRMQAGSRG
jgi:hypothetical protein